MAAVSIFKYKYNLNTRTNIETIKYYIHIIKNNKILYTIKCLSS